MSSSWKNEQFFKSWVETNLKVSEGENIYFLPDNASGRPNAETRYNQIVDFLNNNDLSDIKLIGFSEGAAGVGRFGYEYVNNPEIVSSSIQSELEALLMIECPTGTIQDTLVTGFDQSKLTDLPRDLAAKGIISADIYNEASYNHASGILPGWKNNSYVYNSLFNCMGIGMSRDPLIFNSSIFEALAWWGFGEIAHLHNDPFYDQGVADYISGLY